MIDGTAFDNFNPMVWRFGENNLRNGVYMAVTDAPAALQFNISDLSTKGENSYSPIFSKLSKFDFAWG